MPLSDDQKAMLRLLAQREEGYDDIAALMGLSTEEVRAKVKDALEELAGEGGAVTAEPPPAKVVAPEPEPPPAPAAESSAPAEPAKPSPSQRPARPSLGAPTFAIPKERRRLIALAGGALGIVAVVLIAIAVFGGDSGSGGGARGAEGEAVAAANGNVTQAVLEPVGDSDASGRALFGRVGKEEVALEVTAEGLEPTGKGQSYTVWLYRSPKLALRVGSAQVGEEGELGARFGLPTELLAYVAGGAFNQVRVSRTSDAAYKREVARAEKNEALPRYSGETTLEGKITGPVVKAGAEAGGGNARAGGGGS